MNEYRESTTIALLHPLPKNNHLDEVKETMKQLGSPSIRAIYSDFHGVWLAIEGTHRITAAKELGYQITIIDVTDKKTITCDLDGEKNVDRLNR